MSILTICFVYFNVSSVIKKIVEYFKIVAIIQFLLFVFRRKEIETERQNQILEQKQQAEKQNKPNNKLMKQHSVNWKLLNSKKKPDLEPIISEYN